ncbi:unnamed protein product, partial [Rotaria socialis]
MNHPFHPEFCHERQGAVDNMDYRKEISSWRANSINEVIYYIKKLSMDKNLIDRAWIVFYWVSQNIKYDVISYLSGFIRHQTAEDIFRHKRGVCDAYATIFKALCDGVQLECEKISGFAKGYDYIPKQSTFTTANHAWNVIRLNSHCHLPENPRWQLLSPTISMPQFTTLVEHLVSKIWESWDR